VVEDSKPDIDTRQARREDKLRKKRARVKKRREDKLRKKRARVKKHGQNLARVYMDAILKRLKRR